MSAVLRGTPVCSSSGVSGGPVTQTVTLPTGIVAGDLLYVFVSQLASTGVTMAADNGFVGDTPITSGTMLGQLFRKTAVGTESGITVTVTVTGSGGRMGIGAFAVGTAGAPTEQVQNNTSLTATQPIPSVTPVENSELEVVFAALRYTNVASVEIASNSMSLTERGDAATSNGTGNKAGAWIGSKTMAASTAASGTGTLTPTATATVQGITWNFAFPASGGTGPTPAPAGWDEQRIFTRT
jgi:hypothetical protein